MSLKQTSRSQTTNYRSSAVMTKLNEWLDTLGYEAKPNIEECIAMLGDQIDWLHHLKHTEQDPEWHGEGNVHIHTNMVLSELYELLATDAQHIRGAKRQVLVLGVLLHDVGKTVRTKIIEINGVKRVASPQHEAVGRSYLAFKLMELNLPFEVIWNVLGLVGEHHMPKRLVVKNMHKGDYLALSRRADLEMLYWMEIADMRGRTCPDLASQLEYLEEFKMFAEEYGVWNKGHSLDGRLVSLLNKENDSTQAYVYSYALYEIENNLITLPEESIARTFTHRNQYSNLIIVCGPSGSGKSTWIQDNCEEFELISLDEIREEINGCRSSQKNRGKIIQLAKERFKACLRKKQNVVWDATNLRTDFRKILCDLGRDYKALVTLVTFLLPEKKLFTSNRNRDFSVPDEVLVKQLDSYQFPAAGEAHRMCIIGEDGKLLYRTGYMNNLIHRDTGKLKGG